MTVMLLWWWQSVFRFEMLQYNYSLSTYLTEHVPAIRGAIAMVNTLMQQSTSMHNVSRPIVSCRPPAEGRLAEGGVVMM